MTRHFVTDSVTRWPRRWPVIVISLPAAVATWSGWVGLGEMTGFGKVKLLPGIWDAVQLNTAVTLPIGVEAYAAFALSAALTSAPVTKNTRWFAGVSAVCALLLGMGGQIAYHLLKNRGLTVAPWQITTFVSCLPVLVLGMGAVLAHMLHRDRTAAVAEVVPQHVPTVADAPVRPVAWPPFVLDRGPTEALRPVDVPAVDPPAENPTAVPDAVPEPGPEQVRAAKEFAEEVAAGAVPSIRTIKRTLRIGQPKAREVRAYLTALADH